MGKAKSSLHVEYEDVEGSRGGGGAEILFVCSGDLKNRSGQGKDVKTGYRTKGLIT